MNLPLTFDQAPELGTLILIIVLSALVASVLTQIIKMGWSFVRKARGMNGQPAAWNFVLRGSSVALGVTAAFVMGSGFGWWAACAGIVGGGFASWIVKKLKEKVS